ncbi:hypothetical protein JTE90_012235 [Oedothorax gibbosus]|uniref:Uncharacterized protein n=1 Tax=Oedothorax gibbosus TaxID=931172 RepID=A0AAV6UXB7_9ARAC|nr:hypothetical protein JTE90_012235 [Oedothorax gibbosus]
MHRLRVSSRRRIIPWRQKADDTRVGTLSFSGAFFIANDPRENYTEYQWHVAHNGCGNFCCVYGAAVTVYMEGELSYYKCGKI